MKNITKNIKDFFQRIFNKRNTLWLLIPAISIPIAILGFTFPDDTKGSRLLDNMQTENPDSIFNQPNIDITVNKEYDDYGNLTRYDSTYSYSYRSGNIGDVAFDSLIQENMNMFIDPTMEMDKFAQEIMNMHTDPFADHPFFRDNWFHDPFERSHFRKYFRDIKNDTIN